MGGRGEIDCREGGKRAIKAIICLPKADILQSCINLLMNDGVTIGLGLKYWTNKSIIVISL